jgi:dihydrofolate reductase
MTKVIATMTRSVDGFITGPDDGPGCGLGVGGERLHYWVMGGPWTYDTEHVPGEGMSDADQAYMDSLTANLGAGICGRGMYEAAGAWGGTNPFEGPLFVLTHRLEDAPDPATGFHFVTGFDDALARATAAADGKDVGIAGGADVIRQALAAGVVDELCLSTAPVVLRAGKPLFDGTTPELDLRIEAVHPSPWATHVRYTVVR